MKITIQNTDMIVTLVVNGTEVPARIWEGMTDSGTPVACLITRITPEVSIDDPRIEELTAVFARELQRTAAPTAAVRVFPLRMIL